MKFLHRGKKTLAVFLLINFITQIVAPTVSYALTSGPTAPEFSSFEPVDTTDMVNLATGDFVYNTPILEIPGPEGGYPLSLSYHAGIKLDQEASWVGLGWTLNPGAINRTVDGYADDNAGSKRQVRDYWDGGTQKTKTYSVGVSEPNSGIGINYSIERVNNSYKGFSANSSAGISFSPKTPHSPATNIGKIESQVLSGVQQQTTLGYTIGSNGRSGLSMGDQTLAGGEMNNMAGRMGSFTKKTGETAVPIPYGLVSMKEFYTRFWSDETQALTTFGTLYPGLGNTKINADFYTNEDGNSTFNSYAFDIYDVYDGTEEDLNVETNEKDDSDAAKQLGGTLPAYDRFEVLGQGIGGAIKPYIFENGDLYGQSTYERSPLNGQPATGYPIVGYKTLKKFSNKKVDFRFVGDFSNSLQINPSQIKQNGTELSVDPNAITALEEGFNNTDLNQKLAGSRHIEWFTNEEIVTGKAQQKGFSDFYKNRGDRKLSFQVYENYLQPEAALPYSGSVNYGKGEGAFKTDAYKDTDLYKDLPNPKFKSLKPKMAELNKKIGGFMITNESGVTYHYALPVYNYNEYTRSKLKKPQKDVATFREYKNDDPYAYTWLLTAVTGPDYEDKDGNGVVSDGDIGYWVNFDYGRWADAYQWRTPQTGYLSDVESEYDTFSYGIKELYYLDAVETRTHKAIFIKSKRKDAKGVTSRLEGGSNPRRYTMDYKITSAASGTLESNGTLEFSVSPVSTMKLDAIYLFDKDDLASIPMTKATGKKYNEAPTDKPYLHRYKGAEISYENYFTKEKVTVKENEDFVYVKYHNGKMVYDDDDISQLPQFKEKALRIVELNTDYSLCQNVPNSFGYYDDFKNPATSCANVGGQQCTLDPNKKFDFEWPNYIPSSCHKMESNGQPYCCFSDNNGFYSFDPVGAFTYNKTCLDVSLRTSYEGNEMRYYHPGKLTLQSLKFLGKAGADLLPSTSFTYNHNSDYNFEMYDEWGYYKQDFVSTVEGYTRRTTLTSEGYLSDWSLRSIESPLGAKILVDYEAQQYGKSVYNDYSTFSVEKIEKLGGSQVKITFKEKGIALGQWFKPNDKLDLNALAVQQYYYYRQQDGLAIWSFNNQNYKGHSDSDIISTVSDQDYLIVNSSDLTNLFTAHVDENLHIEYIFFVAGFVKANDSGLLKKYSGGIRVRSLTVENDLGQSSVSEYSYLNPSTGLSSGVTSFKPYKMTSVQYPLDVPFFDEIMSVASSNNVETERVKWRKRLDIFKSAFLRQVSETYKDVLIYSREMPSPGSIYEYVTVKHRSNEVSHEQYTTHHFRVYNRDMITRDPGTPYSDETTYKRNVKISNNASNVGSILSMVTYNQEGEPLTTKTYGYLFDEDDEDFEQEIKSHNQGIVDQTFHKYLTLREYKVDADISGKVAVLLGQGTVDGSDEILYQRNKAIVTTKEERSNTLTSITETDHKKLLTSKKENHAFDFYTGQVTKELAVDSYGHKIVSESVPAYRVKNANNENVYPGMGLKIFDLKNRNMLTQPAASYSYNVDTDIKPVGLLSASIQTWGDHVAILGQTDPQLNVWRKYSTYEWNGQQAMNEDGSYPIAEWLTAPPDQKLSLPFNWNSLTDNPAWEKSGEITLYDVFSHALEAKDLNGNFASTRMDPKQERVIAGATNAAYVEQAYSGTEYSMGNALDEGGVDRGDGAPNTTRAHTGTYSLLVGPGKEGFNYKLQHGVAKLDKKYKASVWVYVPGEGESQTELNKVQLYYSINDDVRKAAHATSQKNKSKSWYLLELDITPEADKDVVVGVRNLAGRGAYFDDFRVHPRDGGMTAYVYDQSTGQLSFMLDGNNFYVHYEYDAMGRLVRTTRELLNFDYGPGKESYRADQVVKELKYNHGENHKN